MWSDWLVFCDGGFQSVCPLLEKDKRLMEASWWERLTEKETGSYFGAMLSKSLIQFSVDGWGCVPSLLFTWGQNYGGGNEDNGDLLQKVPCMHSCTHCPQPWSRSPPTHASAGDSWTLRASLDQSLVGLLLLFPGSQCAEGSVCALQVSIFQSCVSADSSMVGLMETSSKRAYATPKSAAPRAPAPTAGHCWPVPL